MKAWGADIASEGKQRKLMKEQLSNLEIKSEPAPFSFNLHNGDHELRQAPIAFVTDLKTLLFHFTG